MGFLRENQLMVEDDEVARRSERLTLVFETGGTFELPGVELNWWNSVSGRIETAAAPGLSISVTGPALTAEDAASPPTGRSATIAALAIALVLTILVGRRTIPAIRHRLSEQRKRRRRSEAFAFAQFRGALRSGDPMAAHVSLSSWLERLQPGLGPRRFAEHDGGNEK